MDGRKEQWSSKLGFILSSAGAAIGLGAIWKFPYVTGMNGGGAFFLVFIAFTLFIGLPMLVSEFVIGRGAGKEAISAYAKLAPDSLWPWVGRLGLIGSFLLLSFYSVAGGWVLIYTAMSIPGMIISGSANYPELFGTITSSPAVTLLGLALFILINVVVLSFGIQNGIEKANKYMMPLLFIFFIIIVIRALTLEGAMEGVRFFLTPSFENITGESILYALGQSFFALAVGFSVLVTYSSYLERDVSLPSSAGWVAIMNIFVSMLAGLAIFPAVFSFGLEPTEGPGLLFIVLPTVFSQMPLGELFLSLFLLLFLFATLTSSFSLFEIMISAFTEKKREARKSISLVTGLIVFLAGIPAALSFSILKDFQIFGKNVFDATDFLVSNILLPVGCLLIALFIVHRMDKKLVEQEFMTATAASPALYAGWRWLMQWIVPMGIIIVFINLITG
ncbi:NSS family neurotransmitter:Na+ symporter [Melghiribacillus thermohalophilus]|uniref:Transporter n=1 Tax=Melghiribacillus thermohalophilus TaxID=1324956 RepID=A0A4V2V165_9BACI|nr:sodium-dependent transporter [Melghiribacillus thermohalophilus]TCT19662.1 NSS family neurotransmitter:Na+ symporter [Melghiribacillus thermohalophilus]